MLGRDEIERAERGREQRPHFPSANNIGGNEKTKERFEA